MGETNEHRFYKKLSKFIVEYLDEENKAGRKPFQSEIIGGLEMVKADVYAKFSAQDILKKELKEILRSLKGKTLTIDKDNSITIEDLEAKNEMS